MRTRLLSRAGGLFLLACSLVAHGQEQRSFAAQPDLPADQVQSGFNFLTAKTQALQEDSFANPGYLWIDRGKSLFAEPAGKASCISCHQDTGSQSLAGAATGYPKIDAKLGTLRNLEGRINQCREQQQGLPPLDYESEALLSLTSYVTHLSKGMPYRVAITGAAKPFFEQGRDYFFRRKGQLNLACSQCHDDNWGRMLRGDRISQGQPNGYPAYRLEWQSVGSLHRRLRDCDVGIRAEPFALGSPTYTAVELYLVWRARNLALESPGVRR